MREGKSDTTRLLRDVRVKGEIMILSSYKEEH